MNFMLYLPIWSQVQPGQRAELMRSRSASDKGRQAIASPIQLPAGVASPAESLSICSLFFILWCTFLLGFATAVLVFWTILYGPIAPTDFD